MPRKLHIGGKDAGGWFQWDGQKKTAGWAMDVDIAGDCTVCGSNHNDNQPGAILKTYSGTWQDGRIDIQVNYEDGSLSTYIGTYDDKSVNIRVSMVAVGEKGKAIGWKVGKSANAGGGYVFIPATIIKTENKISFPRPHPGGGINQTDHDEITLEFMSDKSIRKTTTTVWTTVSPSYFVTRAEPVVNFVEQD
eukprot:TRINITY_DN2368_c0_g1_i3.p1 TRINITY_DN2368_c0_g1~~TRINITY_DN2368_c0_g1_i3.p1  ORF type:complete len:213 (-),score=43.70 TRINITY_DN2368_c0_g1_i3:57-632(-)